MSLQNQVQQNTVAIQQLIDNAKDLSQIPSFSGVLVEQDLMLFHIDATGSSVSMTYGDFLNILATAVEGLDKTFLYDQGTPAAVWNITHNLKKLPSVTVIDSSNNEVEGEVIHNSIDDLTINFNAAFSGTATLN